MLVSYADNIWKGLIIPRPDLTLRGIIWTDYDSIHETALQKHYFEKEKEKRTTKHAKNYYALTLIYSNMNIKYPIET